MSSPEEIQASNNPPKRRHKRGELPKPVIRRGTLGLFPLNAVSVSYLAAAHADIAIGYPDTAETHAFRNRPNLTMLQDKQKEALNLEGRFFNGFADALYRGQLSEVILAVPTEEGLPTFLEDFADYLEKMLSLGFFLQKKELIKRDTVADLVPNVILTGDGLLYSRFVTGLMRYLRELSSRHGVLTEAMRTRILGRFVRGMAAPESVIRQPHTEILPAGTRQVTMLDIPKALHIAGGSQESQRIIESVLANHGLSVIIESRSRNAVERLEFGQAMWRVTQVIVPALSAENTTGKGKLKKDELKKLASRVEAGILAIGRERRAFEDNDNPASILPTPITSKPAARKSLPDRAIHTTDAYILQSLGLYADALGLAEEKQVFETLAGHINTQITTPE